MSMLDGKRRPWGLAVVVLTGMALAACNGSGSVVPGAPELQDNGAAPPSAVFLMLGDVEIRAEVAADDRSRQQGLMFRESLEPDSGMLFVFPTAARRSFWMLNVPIRLAIAYLGDDGTILEILEMAPGAGIPPDQQPTYPSRAAVRYALEMAGGWFAERGFGVGDTIDLGRAADIAG